MYIPLNWLKSLFFIEALWVAELVICCIPYECYLVLSCHSIWDCQLCHYQLAQHALCVFPESCLLLWKYLVTWPNYLTYDVTYSANVAFILRVLDKAYFFIFCIAFFPHWFFPLLSLWIVPCSIPSIVLANCWMHFSFSSRHVCQWSGGPFQCILCR